MARTQLRDFRACLGANGTGRVDFGDVLNQGTSNFSVSFWIKSDLRQLGSNGIMVGKRSGVGSTALVGWQIYGATFGVSRISVQISDGTTAVIKNGTLGTIRANRWHFIVVTFNRAGSLSIYVDGVLDVSQSISGIAGTITNAVAMRMFQDSSGANQFRGFMDELRFYSRVLTQAEITDIYSLNRFPTGIITGEWLFLDGGGTTVSDTSGGGLIGTFAGSLAFNEQPPNRVRVNHRHIPFSLQCLGGTEEVDIPTLNDISAYTELSFSFWVKHQPKNDSILFGNAGNNTGAGFSIRVFTDDKIRIYHASSTAVFPIPTASPWYHVSGRIVKGSYIQLFLNGVPIAKATGISSTSLQASTNTIKIAGARGVAVLKGSITRVNFWNRALTEAELYSVWKDNTRITSGLIGEWMMDEGSGSTVADSSGNGNTGNITAATFSTDTPMKTRNSTTGYERLSIRDLSKSLYFDGATATVISAATPTGIESSGTLSCWFRVVNPAIGTRQTLVQAGESVVSGKRLGMQLSTDGRLAAGFWNGSSYTPKASIVGVVRPGVWYMATMVWDGSTTTLYLNEVAQTQTSSLVQTDSTVLLRVGCRSASVQPFQGMIDDVKVWTRALSAAEVFELYYRGIIPQNNLFCYWKFDEGSGSTANDTSGNGRTGTITAATYSTDVPMKARLTP